MHFRWRKQKGRRAGRLGRGGVALAAALFAAAGFGAEAPISDRYFRASDGVSLHYREAGHGSAVIVLIPGWLMPAEVFDAQLAELGRRYRVVALSPRSQGGSQLFPGPHTAALRARDVRDFVRHVNPARFVLAGWSLGVIESLVYVQRHGPRHLRGLVLIDNSVGEGPPPATSLRELLPADMTDVQHQAFMREFAAGLFKAPPPPALHAAVERSALRAPLAIARNLLRPWYPREFYRHVVHGVRVPLWYAITPRYVAQAELLREAKPSARVSVFEGAGHALFVDEAAGFNAQLEAFAAPLLEARKIRAK